MIAMNKRYPKGTSPIDQDIMLDTSELWETATMASKHCGRVITLDIAQSVILALVEQRYVILAPTIGGPHHD